MNDICARDGCGRYAKGDDYCSTACFRAALGDLKLLEENAARRKEIRSAKRRKVPKGAVVEVTNPDAAAHLLPGSAGSGSTRRPSIKYR